MKKRLTFLLILLFATIPVVIFAQAPVIIEEPSPRGVVEGQSATFTVKVVGDSLTFQWYVNDTPIGSSNDSVYTTPATTVSESGSLYKVVVSNTYGSDTSISVGLYVTAFEERVTANQIAYYTFQEKTGNQIKDVSGFPNPLDLTINNTASADWSNYALYIKDDAFIKSTDIFATQRITDAILVDDDDEFTIDMWLRPLNEPNEQSRLIELSRFGGSEGVNFAVETIPPAPGFNFLVRTSTTNNDGVPGVVDTFGLNKNLQHIAFTHSKEGFSKIYRNGTEVSSGVIPGDFDTWMYATYLTLGSTVNNTDDWEGIFYRISIYNRALDSAEVLNNFHHGYKIPGISAPFIIEQPTSVVALVGDSVSFKSKVVSGLPWTYQWQKNGVDIPGAVDSFYSIPSVSLSDNGSIYRVIVDNGSNKDTSDDAILSVTLQPVSAPTNLQAVQDPANFRHVKLTWEDNSANETGLIIQRKTGDSASVTPFSKIDSLGANTTTYIDSTVSEATTYTYRVYAVNLDTLSDFSNLSTYTTPLFTIAVPSNLLAVKNPADTHFVKLTWNDNSSNEIGFVLERKKGDSTSVDPFTVIKTLVADAVSFIDSSVIEFTTYTYRVKAFNLYGESSYSNMSSVSTPLFTVPAPTNLIAFASPADSHNVRLMWTDNSPNEIGFVIQRKTGDSLSAEPFANIAIVVTDITIYEDNWVDDSTTYTYRVYAFKIDAVSQYSNLAQILTVVPVELSSFTANIVSGQVQINWETATEVNNSGFAVQRSKDNNKFADLNFVKGQGTTTFQSTYNYTDKSVLSGKYFYRLKQIDLSGSVHFSKSIEVDLGVPKEYVLEQNYPNPFNPSTTIRFALPMNGKVTIKLYNTLGQEVSTILNADLDAGIHETAFNASALSSGVYFYSLKVQGANSSNFTSTKRMILMK